jgi:hypothetical protein
LKRLIEFVQEDGTQLVIEVDEPVPDGGVVRAARPGEVVQRASQTFEAALSRIKPMASGIVSTLQELAQRPDEIQVEFGVKPSANAGAVLAAAGVEGNYKITVIWRKNPGST